MIAVATRLAPLVRVMYSTMVSGRRADWELRMTIVPKRASPSDVLLAGCVRCSLTSFIAATRCFRAWVV